MALVDEKLLDLSFDGGLASGELPHLAVECVLAHAAEEGSVVVESDVGLEFEVGGQLLEAGGLYLELAEGVCGHAVEDLEGDLVSVDYIDADGLDEVEFLAAAEEVVEDDDVDIVSPRFLHDLFDFAASDVVFGEGAVAGLDYVSYHFDAHGFDEGAEFVEFESVDCVVVDVGLEHDEEGSAFCLGLHGGLWGAGGL